MFYYGVLRNGRSYSCVGPNSRKKYNFIKDMPVLVDKSDFNKIAIPGVSFLEFVETEYNIEGIEQLPLPDSRKGARTSKSLSGIQQKDTISSHEIRARANMARLQSLIPDQADIDKASISGIPEDIDETETEFDEQIQTSDTKSRKKKTKREKVEI